MNKHDARPLNETYHLQQIFHPPINTDFQSIIESDYFERVSWTLPNKGECILDKFLGIKGASCCFLRVPVAKKKERRVSFAVQGEYELSSCASGGWLLKGVNANTPSYWIPQVPILRDNDSYGRIVSEKAAVIVELKANADNLEVEITVPTNMCLDMAIWCFQPGSSNIIEELEHPLVIEKQPVFFWTSETTYQAPADLYLYLVHGSVYTNRFIWPRNWKICSELDAYGLYVTLNGLEIATNKVIYNLFKRQILLSVIARQANDGGWYHGEWTNLMESHYRLHNGAMLLLEAALKERSDAVVSKSLKKAAHFISQKTDNIDIGLWFMHDTLEDSDEMMEEMCRVNGSNWIKAPILGKSKTNKLIFNTHVDTLIALEHYQDVTGDKQYVKQVDSARDATREMLALRPASFLYQLAYRAIDLTLLPTKKAEQLPVLLRVIKRLTWMYLTPNLYRLKNKYPRLVMPNGLIERHLGMGHYDINYHPINIMDLARLWRCFPSEDLAQVIDAGVKAVANSSLLDYWAERDSRHKSLVEWVDALYHLYTLKHDPFYRRLLAEGVIKIQETGIGLPPALFGGDFEAVKISQKVPCPSPDNSALWVVNLSYEGNMEVLTVNATSRQLKLEWEGEKDYALLWFGADDQPVEGNSLLALDIPSNSWLWGKVVSGVERSS